MVKRLSAFLLVMAVVAPRPAIAQDQDPNVAVGEVWIESDELRASIASDGIFNEQAHTTIREGGTSALDYTVELYRRRSGWFDSLIETRTFSFRVTYDSFEGKYRLFSEDVRLKSDDFQRVVDQCTRLPNISFGKLDELNLDMNKEYYIVVRAHYQPMSVETLDELRSWMGDEGAPQREEQGRSLGARIAQALMNAAGFGERDLSGGSPRFRPADLPVR